jgi:hypothetical protein
MAAISASKVSAMRSTACWAADATVSDALRAATKPNDRR